jgi:hypothetical protein
LRVFPSRVAPDCADFRDRRGISCSHLTNDLARNRHSSLNCFSPRSVFHPATIANCRTIRETAVAASARSTSPTRLKILSLLLMSLLRLIVINAALIDLNRDTEVRRWNSRCIFFRACVLTVEQVFQLCLQFLGTTAAFRCFKCIHGGPIETPKRIHKL